MTKPLRTNLKKPQKHIIFFRTQRENKIMITLGTQRLRMVEEVEVDLVTLIFQVTFLIFLRIFLEKDLVEEDDREDLIIEVPT